MNSAENYLEINKQSWNTKTAFHLKSAFYDVEGFLKGNTSLNDIELKLLGDVKGKRILHLQCHFGQDTISLARLGAEVTGLDLSDKAIEAAKDLAKQTYTNVDFICCDVYDAAKHITEQYDIVYTSYGTIGWLPDMDKWAKVIYDCLKPGGQFVFVEFHPVVWMFDDYFKTVGYNYFNSGPIVETSSGTYADNSAPITQSYVMWNHGMAEVLNALIKNKLLINSVDEFDYSPYNCFKDGMAIEVEPKKYRIKHLDNKIPMVYSITASK